MERLGGRNAIVTGAGSGIGRAVAVRLAAEGAQVTVTDVDAGAAEEVAREIGGAATGRRLDVASEPEIRDLVGGVVEERGALHVMVNNAGVGVAGTLPDTAAEDWDRIMRISLTGTFFGMKHAIPAIRAAGGGSVINMSSVAALVGIADRAAYSAAKGGVMAMTRAAAMDHVGEGVRINCIAPGTVDTPWVRRITANYPDPEEARERMRQRQPHGRLVTPEEIAAMAAYLASDEAASVIGAVMVVDGGLTAR